MNKILFQTIKPTDILLVVGLGLVVALVSHSVITNPLGPKRLLYLFEAQFAQLQITCSPEAPQWLRSSLKFATRTQGSLTNQIAYIDPNKQLHHCENGWTGDLFRSPVTDRDSRFRYASLTKLFTADAVLALVNEGKIGLDTPLVSILPDILPVRDKRVEGITIAHLLQHTAGFDRMSGQDPMFLLNVKPWCPYNLAKLSTLRLSFDPGTRYGYSNLGYCLLGVVVERVTGKTFRDYIQQEYGLSENGLAFIDGPYLPDEIRYDFRHNGFFGEDYYKYFDYFALSSAAGLSGNAIELAWQVQRMIERKPLSILSGTPLQGCDLHDFQECYGYAVYSYRAPDSSFEVYVQGGTFPGAISLAMMDPLGGIVVWLSAGQPLDGFTSSSEMYLHIYRSLESHYQSRSTVVVNR